VDTILGPEMKSTGEVMGVGDTFAEAFVKSQLAAGVRLPRSGKVFLSVRNEDKPKVIDIARDLVGLGFSLVATRGTAAALSAAGLTVKQVNKVMEGRPHIVDMVRNKEIALIINTVEEDRRSLRDSWSIRNAALQGRVTYYTTLSGARAACVGMRHLEELKPYDLQGLHVRLQASVAGKKG
jgi:carbamoyl-phosphate synthase large subunit